MKEISMLEDLYYTSNSSKRCFESLKKIDRILVNQPSECCAHFPHDISKKQMHALSLLRAPTRIDIALESQMLGKPLRSSPVLAPNIWTAPEKTTVWKLSNRHGGRSSNIRIRMPPALTFGARHSITTNTGRKLYSMVLKYDMAQSPGTLDPLRKIHGIIKSHLSKTRVFTSILPDTTRELAQQITRETPNLSDMAKRKIFNTRAAERVETLFGNDKAFRVYTDCDTIVLGSIDVPEFLATADFLENFGSHGSEPYLCLADVVIALHAIIVSPDETHISMDIRIEYISHGPNMQASEASEAEYRFDKKWSY